MCRPFFHPSFSLEKYLSGYLDEELNSIETTSVCVVVFAGSESAKG
jgi:hypothetical protein